MDENTLMASSKAKERFDEILPQFGLFVQGSLPQPAIMNMFEELSALLAEIAQTFADSDSGDNNKFSISETASLLAKEVDDVIATGEGDLTQDPDFARIYYARLTEFAERVSGLTAAGGEDLTVDEISINLTFIYDRLEEIYKKASSGGEADITKACADARQQLGAERANLEAFEEEYQKTEQLFKDVDDKLIAASEEENPETLLAAMELLSELYTSI